MMKTKHEYKFQNLVCSMIDLLKISDEEKTKRKSIFESNSSRYYMDLCEIFYFLSTSFGCSNTISIDDCGRIYLNLVKKEKEHLYFDILTIEDSVLECDDIIIYIDKALNQLALEIYNYSNEEIQRIIPHEENISNL